MSLRNSGNLFFFVFFSLFFLLFVHARTVPHMCATTYQNIRANLSRPDLSQAVASIYLLICPKLFSSQNICLASLFMFKLDNHYNTKNVFLEEEISDLMKTIRCLRAKHIESYFYHLRH